MAEKELKESGVDKILKAGGLRRFLAATMIGVRDKNISESQAARIGKLAEKMTESLYAELKANQLAKQFDRKVDELGDLDLGNG